MENVRRVDIELSTDSGEIHIEGGCIRKVFIDEKESEKIPTIIDMGLVVIKISQGKIEELLMYMNDKGYFNEVYINILGKGSIRALY